MDLTTIMGIAGFMLLISGLLIINGLTPEGTIKFPFGIEIPSVTHRSSRIISVLLGILFGLGGILLVLRELDEPTIVNITGTWASEEEGTIYKITQTGNKFTAVGRNPDYQTYGEGTVNGREMRGTFGVDYHTYSTEGSGKATILENGNIIRGRFFEPDEGWYWLTLNRID